MVFLKRSWGYINKHGDITKASEIFEISERTIDYWIRKNKDNNLEPKISYAKYHKIDEKKLLEYVKTKPDVFLRELADYFSVGISGIHYALKRLKIINKKNSKIHRDRPSKKS